MEAPPPYQLELGPDVAFVQRLSASSAAGASAKAALAPGMLGRAYLWPWLGLTVRYNRAEHTLVLEPGALQTGAAALEPAADLQVTTLQAALQPTVQIRPTLRLFASAGLGWGSVIAPAIRLPGATLSSIRQRRGVQVEVPLGVGLGWWVLPRWVNISYEASLAPAYSSSGDAYSTDIYVNQQGKNAFVGPLPRFTTSAYHHLSITLTL